MKAKTCYKYLITYSSYGAANSLNLTVRKQPTNTVTYPKPHAEPVARPEMKLNLDEYQFLVLTLKLSIPYTGPEAGIFLSRY